MAEHLVLVLRSVRYQDPSKIVTFLSRTEGMKTGFARGSTSRDNRFGAALEPLTLCRLTGRSHGSGSLYRIHQAAIQDPFRGLHGDFNLLVWSGLIVRFLLGFLPPDHPEPGLFDTALFSLSALDRREIPPEELWIRFAAEALAHLGYRFTLTGCVRCGASVSGERVAYRASDGTIVCMRCFGRENSVGWILTSGDVFGCLCGNGEMTGLAPGHAAGARIFLDAVIREHLPRWIPVGDLAFLKSSGGM